MARTPEQHKADKKRFNDMIKRFEKATRRAAPQTQPIKSKKEDK